MTDIEGNISPKLNKGFFARLFTPPHEKNFIDGCKAIALGEESKIAYEYFSQAAVLADGAFVAGYFAFRFGEYDKATIYFKTAIDQIAYLGFHFSKYEVEMQLKLTICEDIDVIITPDSRGLVLGMAEVCQAMKNHSEAIDYLQRLRKSHSDDHIVLLSLLEILYEQNPNDKDNLKHIIALSSISDNTNCIACAIFLYRAKALLGLGMPDGARETLTKALRLSKDCPTSLRCAFHYDRAIVYEALNKPDRARTDREVLFSENPYYKDISEKLGL